MRNKGKQIFDDFNGGEYTEEYTDVKKWYQEISPDPNKFETVTDEVMIQLKDEAKKCLDSESATFNIKNAKTDPNYRWMKTIMAKGTVSDKIAAYTVIIQNNPVYGLETIRNLIGMVKVGKKKECIAVIETLSDLFLNDLLRPNVKLKQFHQRPLSKLQDLSSGNAATRRKYLSYWYFEDQLKECYTTFVVALKNAAHDTVESNKEKAIAAMSKLLMGNPEQEKNLLANIINKLGDPSQKVASKTMYCLTQLLHKHPNMQGVVLTEVEKMLFRQNVGNKAQYYSLCFLSQFYLHQDYPAVARKLIEVYFSFFKKCIKEGDVDSRMMSALLSGVNRAYPYAKLELEKISEHIDTIYKVVHISNFTVSVQALTLLFQVSDFSNNVNDRYYSALYKKLMDPKLYTSSNPAMLLNLVYKSLLRDKERGRLLAFVKRLLQICLYAQPNFSCGVLFLLAQIINKKPDLNILELKESALDDDDEEEKYVDIKEESTEEKEKVNGEEVEKKEPTEDLQVVNAKGAGWNHVKTLKVKHSYDPLARNPMYSGSEFSAYTELCELRNHFHPSVSLFAEKLLNKEKIIYSGDPLKDFTLIRFLDRFVFKNPKKLDDNKQQPTFSTFGRRKLYQARGIRSIPVTSNGYINGIERTIPVDELFMHTYLQKRYKDKPETEDDGSDMESVASEEFEEMLDKMGGFKDLEEDDIDYMDEIGTSLKNKEKGKKKPKGEDDDDDSEGQDDEEEDDDVDEDFSDGDNDEDLEGEDDELMEDGDDDLINDLDDDDEDGDLVFGGSDSELEDDNDRKVKNKIKKKFDSGSIFASAEEFAALLEEEGASNKKPGSSSQFANKDKADVKQLDWEEKRNHWLTGYKSAVGKGDFKSVKRKGGNKGGSKFGGSKKKFKK